VVREYDLTGKVAFVTGAGRGIGKGIAQVLAEAGADVVINSLTDKYVVGVAAELAKATGRRVVPLVADVTKSADVDRAVARILSDFGRLDVLVNNLGDSIRKPFESVTDEDLKFVMDVNFTASVLCARAVAPHMLGRRAGSIVNIGSFASLRGGAALTIYSAAKTGLVGLTRALALEWAGRGVRVNMIAPGLFPDPVTSGAERHKQQQERARKDVPLGREGQLREVGLLTLYLASSASDYMTGQTLYLDGGFTL